MHLRKALAFAAASLVAARMPNGFEPASENELVVVYGDTVVTSGDVLEQSITQAQPLIGTPSHLHGTYAVLMIDLDIPTPTPGVTTALLHWIQTNLTSSRHHTTITNNKVHILQNTHQTEPLAAYIAPQPSALNPLSHMYVSILLDLSNITPEGLGVLTKAASGRVGFNPKTVLEEVGIVCAVAGTYFNVTIPGPATGSSGPLPTGL